MSTEVQDVKTKLDIVEVVGEYVKLVPGGGQSMKGLCPFHGEKTPSMYVHRDKQFWHCFGCGEGGDIFTFFQKIENLEFRDALKELAKRAGVELPNYDAQAESERAKLLDVLEDATRFFEAALKHQVGERALRYLRNRGVSDATIAEFRLGYAPATWESLIAALAKRGHDPERVAAAGLALASDKGRGHYDRFRDRVMIPLRDERGEVVGFTGRILPDAKDADKTGKYMNTPETAVYRKRRLVFALDRAKEAIKKADFTVLVEGNMDAVSSHQAGIRNVVAVSGTAFSEEMVTLLKRYSGRIALAFDADLAGQNAITRALPHAWKSGMQVFVVLLPEGFKDPDDAIRKDPAIWRKAIIEAKDMLEYAVERALAAVKPHDPFSKKKALSSLKPVFALLEDPVLYDHWTHAVAERLHMSDEAIKWELPVGRGPDPVRGPVPAPAAAPEIEAREERLAKRLLSLIFSAPAAFEAHIKALDPEWLPESPVRGLAKTVKDAYTSRGISALEPKGFFTSYETSRRADPALPPIEPVLLLKERDMAGWTDAQLSEEAAVCMRELEKSARSRAAKEVVAQLGDAEKAGDAAGMLALSRRLERLKRSE